MNYYVYQYLRENGTPYYIGKGKGKRAWLSHKRENGVNLLPKNQDRIQILKENLTEEEALELEVKLTSYYGRKDKGTGILRNMTDGGEGSTGRVYKHAEETKKKISSALKGKQKKPFTDDHKHNMTLAALARTREAFSEEHKNNMKKPKIKVTCPHCKKEGGANTMKRYHFDYCKELRKN
jgi:hypothetical protein